MVFWVRAAFEFDSGDVFASAALVLCFRLLFCLVSTPKNVVRRRCRRKGGRGLYTGGSRVFEGRRRSSWLFWSTTMDFDENEGGLMAVDG